MVLVDLKPGMIVNFRNGDTGEIVRSVSEKLYVNIDRQKILLSISDSFDSQYTYIGEYCKDSFKDDYDILTIYSEPYANDPYDSPNNREVVWDRSWLIVNKIPYDYLIATVIFDRWHIKATSITSMAIKAAFKVFVYLRTTAIGSNKNKKKINM